jgi:outer membrane protein OmpA-like peptidoglycan-associated protein
MLSKERAQTVAEMVKKVVKNPDDIKIVTVGRGETNFKVSNDSDANRKLNRRIEFEFKSDSGEVIKSEEFTK